MDCRRPAILFSTQAPDDPCERINITFGSFSIQAFQLKEHEALAQKTAAAFSNALCTAKYMYNQPEISTEQTRNCSVTVYLAVTSQCYSTEPYPDLSGKKAPTGRVAGIEIRVDPSLLATVTRPSKSGSGQVTMTVTVPQDSNKRKIQSNEGAPRNKRQYRSGKPKGDQKE